MTQARQSNHRRQPPPPPAPHQASQPPQSRPPPPPPHQDAGREEAEPRQQRAPQEQQPRVRRRDRPEVRREVEQRPRQRLHDAEPRVELLRGHPRARRVGALPRGGVARALHDFLVEHRQHDLAAAVDDGPDAVERLEPAQRQRRRGERAHGGDRRREDRDPEREHGGAGLAAEAVALDRVVGLFRFVELICCCGVSVVWRVLREKRVESFARTAGEQAGKQVGNTQQERQAKHNTTQHNACPLPSSPNSPRPARPAPCAATTTAA